MVLLDLSNQQLLEVDAVDTGNNVVSNTEENNNVVTSVQQNSSQRLQRKAGIPISLDDLQQHFGMKLKDVAQSLGEEGVFRFDCIADHRNAAFPSLSFVNPKDRDTPIMTSHNVSSYIPTFECVLGEQIVQIELPIGTSFYGTGEVSGQLERTGKRVFTWNMVAGAYGPGTTSLYQSHPWVLAVLPSGEALGVLADTTRRCEINLQKESIIKFVAPSSYPVITFGPFASPTDVLISLSHAVGTVFMPPKWSLGYHQCRWSYDSDVRVCEIARTFREKGIPCDVIWMDIDYMNGFRCFTFDQERFPDPKSLVKDLHLTGFKAIWMLDPGIKHEEGYFVYDSGSELMSGFKQLMESLLLVYGMLMARSTYEGMKLSNENNCPFVLTKTGFIGSQRYAATWTGDNLYTWEHLHMSISMVIQLGLSSQPLSGPDIGGFEGNATPKLFGRWMGLGAMFPFCRGHSDTGTVDHEPWSFGEECEEVCRLALKRRYRLLPHIYTLFYMAHTRGTSVANPTFFADPKDPRLRTRENSFMLGPLLIYTSTVSDQGIDQLQLVLPKGIWLSFDFDDSHPDLPVLYLQGGSIIPLGPAIQHVGEANPTDDLSLLVALDGLVNSFYTTWIMMIAGKAKGVLFEDDGDGYEFTGGGYLLTTYVAELESSVVTMRISETEGLWKRSNVVYTYNYYLVDVQCIGCVHFICVSEIPCFLNQLDAWGIDGEVLQIMMPSKDEVSNLVSMSEKQYKIRMGTQWLHSRVEVDGYEEFSGTEYRSAGWSEEYAVIE
ncbi:hypothetical protein ACSBR1_037870 [Camellia fascicularis]